MAQQTDNSGSMGVVLGVLLAVVIAVGVYFFMRGENPDTMEPAAGIEAPATTETTTSPDAAPSPSPAPAQ